MQWNRFGSFRPKSTMAAVAALIGLGGCGGDDNKPALGDLDGRNGLADLPGADTEVPDDANIVDDLESLDMQGSDVVGVDTETLDVQTPDVLPADTNPDITTADLTSVDVESPDIAPGEVDPFTVGPFPVTTREVEVAGYDAVLYTPTRSALSPAVVLAPGFQVSGSGYAHFGQHLASHGIAVLIPTFGDNFLRPIDHSDLANDVIEMVAWLSAEVAFDSERIGAGGHSRGGKVSILAAIRDDRVRASFNLDPVDSVGPNGNPNQANPSVTPELMGGLTVPLGVIGAGLGATPSFPGAPVCAPTADNHAAYVDAATSTTPEVEVLAGAGHNDFVDPLPLELRLICKGGDNAAEVRRLSRGYMTAFYRVHLAGDSAYAPFFPVP